MTNHLLLAATVVATSFATAFAALVLAHYLLPARQPRARAFDPADDEDMVFLFEDELLVDASDAARDLLARSSHPGSDWARLAAVLAPQFPDLDARMAPLADAGALTLHAEGEDALRLTAEALPSGRTRIALADPLAEGGRVVLDAFSHRALQREVADLRAAVSAAPVLMWRRAADGRVTWANDAYLSAARNVLDVTEVTWPLPELFPDASPDSAPTRLSPGGRPGTAARCYECHARAVDDGRALLFAIDCDATVRAETALGEFRQTLTRTFAQMPVGIAVFDRHRELQVFNPALIDLTGLEPEFLSGRPSLVAVLDRLREQRMIPEPRDYASWRRHITDVDRASAAGDYEETWTLPTGQTYRVTGRPHPDGGIALMFEDISTEISLSQRFRSELETAQAVLDTLDEAIAVFSPAGLLVMANAAYARLWGVDPMSALSRFGLDDAIEVWGARCAPAQPLEQLRDTIAGERAHHDCALTLHDGRRLACRVVALAGGARLVGFRAAGPVAPAGDAAATAGAALEDTARDTV